MAPGRSATGNSLGVMGPQLGYYYPEIVQQIHLKGPGFESQGVGVPGLSMYQLIGRTQDYAWSLTSANHDVRDVFAEQLCEPDGSAPDPRLDALPATRARAARSSSSTRARSTACRSCTPSRCTAPVIGTATVGGKPIALTRKRSTFGRDGLNLGALKDMSEGKATSAERFFDTANQFGFTFNWAYVSRTADGLLHLGPAPEAGRRARPAAADRSAPAATSGRASSAATSTRTTSAGRAACC